MGTSQRISVQRRRMRVMTAVVEAVNDGPAEFTAKEIAASLDAAGIKTSLATVRRIIDGLVEDGVAEVLIQGAKGRSKQTIYWRKPRKDK